MIKETPIQKKIIMEAMQECKLDKISQASIREIKKIADITEKKSGVKFIRMEMGIPGLPPCEVGVNAQIQALKKGIASIYPDIQGIPILKKEASKFIKLFMNIDIDQEHCLPTVGSMMAGYATFATVNRMYSQREGTLFLDPGFPVQKMQCKMLGQDYMTFDLYDYRGEKLKDKLESYLKTGKVSSILYSNPNNPSWVCLTEKELQIIGTLATKYNAIVVEDLAYFGMDFRKDYSQPGKPPYQPTVANYTDNYILFLSSSKIFSYAGERIGVMAVSDKCWDIEAEGLLRYYNTSNLGRALVFGALYSLSSGTSHSAQYGLAEILKNVNEGKIDFIKDVKIYGEKAQIMKKIFTQNGFKIVYDKDLGEDLADGFYFTISYPQMSGQDLLCELLHYGISAIGLKITGSSREEGLRACTSLIQMEEIPVLEERLKIFRANNPI